MRHLHLVALTALFAACGPTTGIISGTITQDGTAAALADATVTTDPATTSATTDAAGAYELAELAPGTYKVIVAKEGFVTKERAGVLVAAGQVVDLDVVLALATGNATLTVTDGCANAPLAGATVVRDGTVTATTDASGQLDLAELDPGTYSLKVSATGFLPNTLTLTITAGSTAELDTTLVCQSKAAADLARAYLATLTTPKAVTSATALHDKLYDSDNTNDPKVISVRAATDYANGHIPGAINIPWKNVADETALELLGAPGAHAAGYVDYCYTGHTGGIASAVLSLMGYPTANLKYGIVSWTRNTTALGSATPPDLTKDFATETTANTAASDKTPPVLAFAEAETAADVVKLSARAYLKDPAMVPTISAQALFDNLNDGNTANDPFIISVRAPEHYALGHIPGAINIPYLQIALEENLKKIPTDREIVVYCYTGHTGAFATGVLGTLGYHKVKNLKYGMAGWTQNATVRATTVYSDASDAHDFPVNTGTSP